MHSAYPNSAFRNFPFVVDFKFYLCCSRLLQEFQYTGPLRRPSTRVGLLLVKFRPLTFNQSTESTAIKYYYMQIYCFEYV